MHAYYEPLLRSRRGASPLIVSQEVIHAIFGVLPEITVVHKQLLARLQHRCVDRRSLVPLWFNLLNGGG